jgi:hypothetical protein
MIEYQKTILICNEKTILGKMDDPVINTFGMITEILFTLYPRRGRRYKVVLVFEMSIFHRN